MKFHFTKIASPAFGLLVGVSLSLEASENGSEKTSSDAVSSAVSKIDALIEKGHEQHSVQPNPAISDDQFVRRIHLDIGGRIPTIEKAAKFRKSSSPQKRGKLINDLLASDAYVSHFYNFWADILRINHGFGNGSTVAEGAYQMWLKDALRENMPYDQFVTELVTGHGKIWESGAIAYYMRDRGMPLENMSNTVRVFLGTRMECAQCHDHPFDKWTQMDFFKMAAFSYGMDTRDFRITTYDDPNRNALEGYLREERKRRYFSQVKHEKFPIFRSEELLTAFTQNAKKFEDAQKKFQLSSDEFVTLAKRGIAAAATFDDEYRTIRTATAQTYNRVRFFALASRDTVVKLPHDYAYSDAKPKSGVAPATMFGDEIDFSKIDQPRIDAYGSWMTSKTNPTFSKVIANRLWKKVMGHGIFEPVDELTDQTVVTNPELLDFLENLIRDLDFDMKAYMAVLYQTKTYQRSATATEIVPGIPYYFPGPSLRRLSAEQLWDSVVALTLPDADRFQPRLKGQKAGLERVRRMHTELEGRTWENYFATMKKMGAALRENYDTQAALRVEIFEAKKAKSNGIVAMQTQLAALQKGSKKIITEIGFRGTDEFLDGNELIDRTEVTTEMPERPADADRVEYAAFVKQVRGMARASELTSPAPRGHFLREFGQSDREVIENATQKASVPQALDLLNGGLAEAMANPFAVFGKQLNKIESPSMKIDLIFHALLSRDPTAKEKQIAEREIEEHGEDAYQNLVWALLNTQQFLFNP